MYSFFYQKRSDLIKTFALIPEYLKTDMDDSVNNYSDWGIPLGRKFRSLKLWFVLRMFGEKGLQHRIAQQIKWAKLLEKEIESSPLFELIIPAKFNLLCFRHIQNIKVANDTLNELNKKLLVLLNSSGKMYLSHTVINSVFFLRLVIGQTNVTQEHVKKAWSLMQRKAQGI